MDYTVCIHHDSKQGASLKATKKRSLKNEGTTEGENQDGFPRQIIFCIAFVIFDQITFLCLV